MFRDKIMLVIAVLSLLMLSNSLLWSQRPKIAYINSEKIKAEYREAQDADKKLQDYNAQWEKEAIEKQREIENLQNQLDAQSLLLSEEKKREKYDELQKLSQDFERFKEQKWGQQGEIFRRQEEIWKPIYDKIFAAINKIAEDDDYDIIFDSAMTVFLFIDPKRPDLTAQIVEELNKGLLKTQ
ncbi:OmpH family outer membrane protein [candidate division KSB1 bacterium]|nr:OmpH family outer membrane protein [candidate division KSB1 bacterium]